MAEVDPTRPNDGRALAAVAVQFFVNGAIAASFIPRLPELRDRLGLQVDDIGLLLSASGVASLATSAVVGRIVSRFGTRSVIAGGGILICAALVLVGNAPTWSVLALGLCALMASDVLVDVAMNLQGSWLSARRREPVMNRLHGLWSMGGLVGGIVTSRASAAGIGLGLHSVLASVLFLIAILTVVRNLPAVDTASLAPEHLLPENGIVPPPDNAGPSADPDPRPDPGDHPSREGSRRFRLAVEPSGRAALALFALAGGFAITVEATSLHWSTFRITDDFGVGPGVGTLGYVAVAMGMTVGRLTGDHLTVRLGPRLQVVSTLVAGLGVAAATLVPVLEVSLAGYLAAGFGMATMLPTLYDQAAQRPGRTGDGLGALSLGLRSTDLLLPLVVGSTAATSLSVGSAVAVVALPAAVGFLVASALLKQG